MNIDFGFVLQVVTFIALLTGILFGILEVRRARDLRAEKAALDVFDITVQRDIIDALVKIFDLPLKATPEQVRKSSDVRIATQLIMNLFEYWGIMVFYRIVPLRTLDLLVGGVVRGSWSRLENYVLDERISVSNPALAEWFQWLADRLVEYPQPEKEFGAHVAFSKWKP